MPEPTAVKGLAFQSSGCCGGEGDGKVRLLEAVITAHGEVDAAIPHDPE